MASTSGSNTFALTRSVSHLTAPSRWGGLDIADNNPFEPYTTVKSPYELQANDLASVKSFGSSHVLEHVNLGPAPLPDAPGAQPIELATVSRFNSAQRASAGASGRAPTQRLFPTTHIAGRTFILSGAETLASGLLSRDKRGTIVGSLLLAGGVMSSVTATATVQRTLRGSHRTTAQWIGLANLLGTAALAGGGVLRQYAERIDHKLFGYAAMALLAAGSFEAAGVGGVALSKQEQMASTMPSNLRANLALWALDAGVVTTMTYGLATRLNQFAPIVDNIILGSAYTACLGGAIWQYADCVWFRRNFEDLQLTLSTTWWPTVMMVTAFSSKIGVLAGVKFAVDGYAALAQDRLLSPDEETNARLALILGGTGTLASLLLVSVPQLAYFHPNLKASGHRSPWSVTAAVHVGALLLALGAGLREWAALQRNLALARGAMAIAGTGALSVVACSSMGLAASELNRGHAPLKYRPEFSLGLASLGFAIGVAYGLSIRDNNDPVVVIDVLLAASYLALGIGGAMSFACAQLYKASSVWGHAEIGRNDDQGQGIALETLR